MLRLSLCAALIAAPALAQTQAEIAALVTQFKAELTTFAEHVATCSAFEQDYMIPGTDRTMERAVVGTVDGQCEIRLEAVAAAPTDLVCRLAEPERLAVAAGWQAMADNILPDGSSQQSWPNGTHPDVSKTIISDDCQEVPR